MDSKPQYLRYLLCGAAILVPLAACMTNLAMAETGLELARRLADDNEKSLRNSGVIFFDGAAAPAKRILLIRKGSDMCALRFTAFRGGGDAKPGTVFNTGDETKFAEYDWFYQGGGSGNLTGKNARFGHEKLQQNALVGIGRLAFQTGRTHVVCGPIKLNWDYPYRVLFYLGPKIGDYGYEMAPTGWSRIEDVKATDPRLIWYRYDEMRKPVIIPISDLIGGEKTKE